MQGNRIWNKSYIVLFCINLVVNVSFYMTSTALSRHLVQLGMTAAIAGSIIGAMSLASMVTRPITGWICDHFSRRTLLLLALAVNFICVCGYGLSTSVTMYMLLRVFHGISFGMTTTVVMVLISGCIPENRMGEGMGYFGLTQTLAVAVGPWLALTLYDAIGSSKMFIASSGCVVVACLMTFLLKNEKSKKNEQLAADHEFFFRLTDFFAKEAIIFGIVTIAVSATNGIENGFIALYADELGYSNVGWYFSVSATVLLLSRTFISRLADKVGFFKALILSSVFISASLLSISLGSQQFFHFPLALGAILKAIGVGTIQPALQAATIRSVEPSRRGAATSTFYIGTDLGQSLAPMVAGNLIDSTGYQNMWRFFIIPVALVLMIYWLFDFRKRKLKKAVQTTSGVIK